MKVTSPWDIIIRLRYGEEFPLQSLKVKLVEIRDHSPLGHQPATL